MTGRARRFGLGLCVGLVVAAAPLPRDATTDSSGSFTLATDQGRQLSLADLRGRVVVLTFGYTSCPDVCPTTLMGLAGLMGALGSEAAGVQVLFVTLDPERDTPERLHAYVRHFDPRFVGLRGSPEEVSKVAAHYGVRFALHRTPGSALTYTVDHGTNLYLIDGQGALAAILPYGTPSSRALELLRGLLATVSTRSISPLGQAQ